MTLQRLSHEPGARRLIRRACLQHPRTLGEHEALDSVHTKCFCVNIPHTLHYRDRGDRGNCVREAVERETRHDLGCSEHKKVEYRSASLFFTTKLTRSADQRRSNPNLQGRTRGVSGTCALFYTLSPGSVDTMTIPVTSMATQDHPHSINFSPRRSIPKTAQTLQTGQIERDSFSTLIIVRTT
jgi:hypothetical protein